MKLGDRGTSLDPLLQVCGWCSKVDAASEFCGYCGKAKGVYPLEVPFEAIIAILGADQAGKARTELLEYFALSEPTFNNAAMIWFKRYQGSRLLSTYTSLRIQREVWEHTRNSPALSIPAAMHGNWVRTNRCKNCGGPKTTIASTAYIYCDFCATFYDMDLEATVSGSGDGYSQLIECCEAEMKVARERDDREKYGSLHRLVYQCDMDVDPAGWSPRIKDPLYREAMLNWCVDSVVYKRFDKEFQSGTWQRFKEEVGGDATTAEEALKLLDAYKRMWNHEVAICERYQLFRLHPDNLDASMYLHINKTVVARNLVKKLKESEQARFLDAAGIARDYVAAVPIPVADATCGRCGAHGVAPSDSKNMVCEACGAVLDVGARRFDCTGCAAPLVVPRDHKVVRCGFCDRYFSGL